MKFSLFLAIAFVSSILISLPTTADAAGDNVWNKAIESRIPARGTRGVYPDSYEVYRLDQASLRGVLERSPMEFSEAARQSENIFSIPTPDGRFERFRIIESPVLSPDLSAQYPDWKTYQAYGVDDPAATARLGWTLNGFHATVWSPKGTYQVDPYQLRDVENYIVYFKKDVSRTQQFHCDFDEQLFKGGEPTMDFLIAPEFSHGTQIRTYRLAIAVTAEYTAVFGSQANALAQVTTTANRMNGIYRKDFAVGLQLVSGTNLIYTDPATDPYTNVINSAQLDANQTNINTVVGVANYDVGHLFATSNNGLANLSSFCGASKARGASGQPNPQGDGFDVDYVAHEIGHQIGANHTFNSDPNCGSGSTAARKEPGSGATIMSYAGICSSTSNLQRNSIDNFLGHSQQEAIAFLGAGGAGCGTLAGSNQVPTVTAPAAVSIPFNTPYALTATASDGNGDPLTYSWEHNTSSGGLTSNYPATTDDDDTNLGASRILMRPYSPSTSPTRTFPSLTYILNNANEAPVTFTGTSATGSVCAATCITGEDLPSVARTINYRVTVRDNLGGVADATTDVTFVNTTTPFTVTSQNSAVSYAGNSAQTVTWNVSGTTAAPINTANVKITFSADGGTTFPYTLVAATPNDGSDTILIPNVSTTTGRIKVEAVSNIFFDINNASVTVTAAPVAGIRAPFDYDGDDKTDLSIFRPGVGQWWVNRSSNGTNFALAFGSATDEITPADFTGDQKSDFAFFRSTTGAWFVLRSEDFSFFSFPFGTTGDTPITGDFDGDGKADATVFRPSTNTWFIQKSTGGTDILGFGAAGDKPVVGDYDGDGKADIAIFRPSVGQWWVRRSSNGTVFALAFGVLTDKPVQGYYTADNKTDIALWRPSTGTWFILRSEDNSFYSAPFGVTTDITVPGDYDGDDRYDTAVFRPSTNTWFVQRTTAGTLIQAFGAAGDIPTPNAYVP
ncbi:MAG: VCBS repeat-containing protein [Acidobacteria bacterium]|nr:VCBS repeat-containing protein [Acidobacteriota bacterium]